MRDRCGVARGMFVRTIQVAPTYAAGHVLFGLSLLGLKPLQYAISQRRQVIGHTFDDVAGAQKGNATGAVPYRRGPAMTTSELLNRLAHRRPARVDVCGVVRPSSNHHED